MTSHIVLVAASFVMLFPLLWQISMSFATQTQVVHVPPVLWPGVLHPENYLDALNRLPFLNQLMVSIAITVVRTVGQLVFCTAAGYAYARLNFPLRRTTFGLMLAVLMVPGQVFLLPQYQMIQALGWLNTIQGIALPGIVGAFGVFLMSQFFRTIPAELEKAARLDGANTLQIFAQVMLPLAKPGLSALAIITVLYSWNDLLWPLIVATDSTKMPLSAGIATLTGEHTSDLPLMMAASLMAMAPIVILFLVMHRRVIEGIASVGVK